MFRKRRKFPLNKYIKTITRSYNPTQTNNTNTLQSYYIFSDIFLNSNHSDMLIYLKGVNSIQLEHVLEFIYNGETFIANDY